MMQAELTEQLGYEKNESEEKETPNRRNRKSSKTLRTDQGPMEIDVPRDRDSEFEPKVIAKHQIDVSPELISRVTDEVKEMVEEWRNRPLDPIYPVIFLDALRVNIRDKEHISKKAVYLALAIHMDGQKEHRDTKYRTGCGLRVMRALSFGSSTEPAGRRFSS